MFVKLSGHYILVHFMFNKVLWLAKKTSTDDIRGWCLVAYDFFASVVRKSFPAAVIFSL